MNISDGSLYGEYGLDLTVELLELVDECISLEESIEGDELPERKKGLLPDYLLPVDLLDLVAKCISFELLDDK